MSYFHVKSNTILSGPRALPNAWKYDNDNVSGLNNASAVEKKAIGWIPQTKVGEDASYNAATHKLTGPVNVIDASGDFVTSTWTVELKSQGEIDADIAAAAASKAAQAQEAIAYITGPLLRDIVNDLPQVVSVSDVTLGELATWMENSE